jgi:hypothetical protein
MLANFRFLLDQAVHINFDDDYLELMALVYNVCPSEQQHFDINSGIRCRYWSTMTQLRCDVAHCFVRKNM